MLKICRCKYLKCNTTIWQSNLSTTQKGEILQFVCQQRRERGNSVVPNGQVHNFSKQAKCQSVFSRIFQMFFMVF